MGDKDEKKTTRASKPKAAFKVVVEVEGRGVLVEVNKYPCWLPRVKVGGEGKLVHD